MDDIYYSKLSKEQQNIVINYMMLLEKYKYYKDCPPIFYFNDFNDLNIDFVIDEIESDIYIKKYIKRITQIEIPRLLYFERKVIQNIEFQIKNIIGVIHSKYNIKYENDKYIYDYNNNSNIHINNFEYIFYKCIELKNKYNHNFKWMEPLFYERKEITSDGIYYIPPLLIYNKINKDKYELRFDKKKCDIHNNSLCLFIYNHYDEMINDITND